MSLLKVPTQTYQQVHRQIGRQDGNGLIFSSGENIASRHGHPSRRPGIRYLLKRRSVVPACLLKHVLLVLAFWVTPLSAQAIDIPATEAARFAEPRPITSDNGYAIIAWEADGAVSLDIKRSDAPVPARTLYRGENKTYFISGLSDGVYTLTLRDQASGASDSFELTVAHQSLTLAFWLIALGLLIFLSTVWVIMRGARDE